MKKKINKDEIDLIDFFFIIKQNFIKIFSISLVSTILMIIYLFNQNSNEQIYSTKTAIEPISTFDLSEYSAYNNYLRNVLKKFQERNNLQKISKDDMDMVNEANDRLYKSFDINKDYLMQLFIDQLKEREIFIEAIKKFDLINQDNFKFEKDFEDEVRKVANNIKITQETKNKNLLNNWNLEFQVSNIKKWNSFLFFIEKKTNENVRKYLNKSFENLIVNEERLKKYAIEDLEIEIFNSDTDLKLKQELLKNKQILIQDKKTERLEDLFQATPVLNPNKFYAAKIKVHSTTYSNQSKNLSKTPLILSAAIISFILGTFYVFISHSIRVRSKLYN